ncbi:unnamed protein product [Ectocarpus sp. 12 AP-2014]
MGRDYTLAAVALAVALLSRQSLGFHIPVASSRRSLQQRSPHSAAFSPPNQQRRPTLPTRSLLRCPLAAETDDGGGGGGFSSAAASEEKRSRKAAKKAKARGGAGPAVELKKAANKQPQEVSKSVVAEVLGAQAAKEGGATADQVSARKEIERMEAEERERIAKRQERIDSVMQAKAATEGDPDAGSIPEIVSNRMLSRMVPFFLLPALGGIGVFVAVYVLSHKYDYTIPAYIVAYATQAPFFVALAGITYAIMSASWDEDREGTFFGFDEAKRNFGNIVEGLRRSSDRMDVEDMLADQERMNMNRRQRRQMRKEDGGEDEPRA